MKNQKLMTALTALTAFTAIAGCSDAGDREYRAAERAEAKDAEAYAKKNGCQLNYYSNDETAGYQYSDCDTDPENRGRTKAEEASIAAEEAKQAALFKAHKAWEAEAIRDGIYADTKKQATAEKVYNNNSAYGTVIYTRVADFKTGQLCIAFAKGGAGDCTDFGKLTATQSAYVGQMRERLAQEKAYQAREPQKPTYIGSGDLMLY